MTGGKDGDFGLASVVGDEAQPSLLNGIGYMYYTKREDVVRATVPPVGPTVGSMRPETEHV